MNLHLVYNEIKQISTGSSTKISLCEIEGRKSVLKELTNANFIDYSIREIETLRALNGHPNILKLHNSFIFGDRLFLDFEYYDGGDIYDDVVQNGIYTSSKADSFLEQMLSAIEYAKQKGYMHCDIKPENILLDSNGNFILSDWDMSQKLDKKESSGLNGSILNTPPEVLLGKYENSSDLYSLGCVLYFVLSGKRVYDLTTKSPKFLRLIAHLAFEIDTCGIDSKYIPILQLLLCKKHECRNIRNANDNIYISTDIDYIFHSQMFLRYINDNDFDNASLHLVLYIAATKYEVLKDKSAFEGLDSRSFCDKFKSHILTNTTL